MLQSVRDNLKGTVVTAVILLFFVLPMVITGVGSSWLGSVAGTDAAVVDGREITRAELSREVYMQKQRLLSQEGVDPSADFLKEENLQKPVLERLTKKAAILAAAERGGMAVSDNAVNSMIVTQKEFQVDGKFDAQQYRSLLARIGLTPATYKDSLAEDMMLGQLNGGIELSSFVTEKEVADLVAIIYEKRSFYTVEIPAEGLADSVSISDEEISSYYDENKEDFREPEKVMVEYVETSVNQLAKSISISDEDIKKQYEQELENFNATPEYEIAHILVEGEGDKKDATVALLQAKIAKGEDFSELAKSYSADAGSRDQGGNLGVMVDGVYPEGFESAVKLLDEGQVSAPVVTDAGTHLVKVLKKTVPEAPSFEDRKSKINRDLQIAKAEEIYLSNVEKLEELTFSAPDLASAAAELGSDVKVSGWFERTTGIGIAGNPEIRKAAFETDVLIEGHNSRVIELAGNRAVVIRKKEHSPEHIKSLDEIKTQVTAKLSDEKVLALLKNKADEFIAAAKSSDNIDALATDLGYSYALFEDAARTDPVADPATRSTAFSLPIVSGEIAFDAARANNGDYRIVGVISKTAGSAEDIEDAQLKGLSAQLKRENSRYEGGALESEIVANADIKLH